MLQGFISVTTFTTWKSSFRFDSLHEEAFSWDDDHLEKEMENGERRWDEDGRLAMELESTVHGGDPYVEGVVYPRIAEVSLLGGLGCGKVITIFDHSALDTAIQRTCLIIIHLLVVVATASASD